MKLRHTLAAGAAALCLAVSAHAAEFITVLTGGTSGVYYPLGVALSQIYGKALPNAKTSSTKPGRATRRPGSRTR